MSSPADDRWDAIEAAFHAARRLPPERREAWFEQQAMDPAVREEVEQLLAHDRSADSFLGTPVLGETLAPTHLMELVQKGDEQVPDQIAGYRILSALASGGMGQVFVAEQENPNRRVALKLLRLTLADERGRARFQREAEILASLSHEGIARIYESGLWRPMGELGGAGLPWFAMELCEDALPLTQWADQRDLHLADRLELFARVCDAMHYGHLRGVVHRDLKPQNILVTGAGDPKVIDFGVARSSALAEAGGAATRTGEWFGTLRYMSPEQCGDDPRAIDVRSDVYSLGVLLFELLTGEAPYELPTTSLAAAALAIRELPVVRASSIDPRLRGDLDTILCKAMAKLPAERYASAGDLARDLRHVLAHEPVEARALTTWYVLGKWVRRRKAVAVAVGALCLGGLLAAGGLVKALRAESVALAAQAAEVEERWEATRQRDEAESVTRFLESLLANASPYESERDFTVAEVLEAAGAELDRAFPDAPHLAGRMAHTLGIAWGGMAQYDKASELFQRALELRETALGPEHPEVADARVRLAHYSMLLGRRKDCRDGLERAIPVLETNAETHAGVLLMAHLRAADLDWYDARLDEAFDHWERAGQVLKEHLSEDAKAHESYWYQGSRLHAAGGDHEEAVRLANQAITSKREDPDSAQLELAECLTLLSAPLAHLRRYDEARDAVWEALELVEQREGRESAPYVLALEAWVRLEELAGELEEAVNLGRDAIDLRRQIQPAGHPDRAYGAFQQARRLCRAKLWVEAHELYDAAVEEHAILYPKPIDETGVMRGERGNVRRILGLYKDAETDLRFAFEFFERELGPQDSRTRVNADQLVRLYRLMGREDDARTYEKWLADSEPGTE